MPPVQAFERSEFLRTVLAPAGLGATDFRNEPESVEYAAARFALDEHAYLFRMAKQTPTKIGRFVTVWARDAGGPIRPFGAADGVAGLIVGCTVDDVPGYYVFPRLVLMQRGVFDSPTRPGKRAFRVYPPGTHPVAAAARSSQAWQNEFYITGTNLESIRLAFARVAADSAAANATLEA